MQGPVPRPRLWLELNRKDAIHTPLLFSLGFNTALFLTHQVTSGLRTGSQKKLVSPGEDARAGETDYS